jgi:ribosomal protein L40E
MIAKKKRDAKSAQENAGATTRVCRVCGRDLPLDAFGSHAKTWDHKATVCKECMADRLRKNKAPKPTPAPVLDEGIRTVKATPVDEPILLADIDTGFSLENVESIRLVEELRARGYTVTCQRPITVIEEL